MNTPNFEKIKDKFSTNKTAQIFLTTLTFSTWSTFGENMTAIAQTTQVKNTEPANSDLIRLAIQRNAETKYQKRLKSIENYPPAPVTIINIEGKPQSVNSNVDNININYEDGTISSAAVSKTTGKQTELVPIDVTRSDLFNETTVSGILVRPSETVNKKSFTQNIQTQFLNIQAQAVVGGKLLFRPNAPMVVPNSNGGFDLNPKLQFTNGTPRGVKFTGGVNALAPEGFAEKITTGTRSSRFKAVSKASLNIGGMVGSKPVGEQYNFKNKTEVASYGVITGEYTQRSYSTLNPEENNFTTKISGRGVYVNTYNPEANIANFAGVIPLGLKGEKKQAENARIKREQNPNAVIPPFEASNLSNQLNGGSVKTLNKIAERVTLRTIPQVANLVEANIITNPNTGNSFGYQYSAGSIPVQTSQFFVEKKNQINPKNLKLQMLMDITTGNPNTRTIINGQDVTGNVAAISSVAVFQGKGTQTTTVTNTNTTKYAPTISAGAVYSVANPSATNKNINNIPPNILTATATVSASLIPADNIQLIAQGGAVFQPLKDFNIYGNITSTNLPTINNYNNWTIGSSYKLPGVTIYGNYTNNEGNQIPFYPIPKTSLNAGVSVAPMKGVNINTSYFQNNSENSQQNLSGYNLFVNARSGNFYGGGNTTISNNSTNYGVNAGLNFPTQDMKINVSATYTEENSFGANPAGEVTVRVEFNKKF